MATDSSRSILEHSLLRSTSSSEDLKNLDQEKYGPRGRRRAQTSRVWLDRARAMSRLFSWKRHYRLFLGLILFLVLITLRKSIWREHPHLPFRDYGVYQPSNVHYTPGIKPDGLKIIGLVFYGRRDRASILDCYLKKNLVKNGGWLDEVLWVAHTNIKEDLEYLDELIPTANGTYKKTDARAKGYANVWAMSVERGNLYIKLDDDVVFINDKAIASVVHTKLTRPEALLVSANMVNSPELNWLHYRSGAIHPYLPELTPPPSGGLSTDGDARWRPSRLPIWTGPADWKSPDVKKFKKVFEHLRRLYAAIGDAAGMTRKNHIPKHRWLPLANQSDIIRTPIAQTEYGPFGSGWNSWAIDAQQHYSLLENLEKRQTDLYYLNHGNGPDADATWNMAGDRLSINFLAVDGDTIIDNLESLNEDEKFLSVTLPKKLGKSVLVNTHAIASHYSFRKQQEVESTDVLARYRAYAIENVCPGGVMDPYD